MDIKSIKNYSLFSNRTESEKSEERQRTIRIMDIKFTIEQFDNGITLRWQDIDGDRAIVIHEHSINAEVGKIIMEDVTASMNNTNKVTLSIKIESDEQQ